MGVGGEFGVELGVGGIDTATVGVSEISFFSSVFFFSSSDYVRLCLQRTVIVT